MDVGVVRQESFFVCMVEVCAVIHTRLFCWCAPKDLGAPGIEVRIEVDNRNGTVCGHYAAQEGKSYGMVTS